MQLQYSPDTCRFWDLDNLSGFFLEFILLFRFWQACSEDGSGRSAVHVSALVGPLGVVAGEVGVEIVLHLIKAVVELGPPHDPEALV